MAQIKAAQIATTPALWEHRLPRRDCLLRVFCSHAMKRRTIYLRKMRHLPLSGWVVVFELLVHPLTVIAVACSC